MAAYELVTGGLDGFPESGFKQTRDSAFPSHERTDQVAGRATSSLGEWILLSVIRPGRRTDRHPQATWRVSRQFFCLFSSHPRHLLSDAVSRHQLGEEWCRAAGCRLDGQPGLYRMGNLDASTDVAALKGVGGGRWAVGSRKLNTRFCSVFVPLRNSDRLSNLLQDFSRSTEARRCTGAKLQR